MGLVAIRTIPVRNADIAMVITHAGFTWPSSHPVHIAAIAPETATGATYAEVSKGDVPSSTSYLRIVVSIIVSRRKEQSFYSLKK